MPFYGSGNWDPGITDPHMSVARLASLQDGVRSAEHCFCGCGPAGPLSCLQAVQDLRHFLEPSQAWSSSAT